MATETMRLIFWEVDREMDYDCGHLNDSRISDERIDWMLRVAAQRLKIYD